MYSRVRKTRLTRCYRWGTQKLPKRQVYWRTHSDAVNINSTSMLTTWWQAIEAWELQLQDELLQAFRALGMDKAQGDGKTPPIGDESI